MHAGMLEWQKFPVRPRADEGGWSHLACAIDDHERTPALGSLLEDVYGARRGRRALQRQAESACYTDTMLQGDARQQPEKLPKAQVARVHACTDRMAQTSPQ